MLKCEQNTPEMADRILIAATAHLRRSNLDVVFEHGQWWITDLETGAQWSVVDADGIHTTDGFDFEQVTDGEDD